MQAKPSLNPTIEAAERLRLAKRRLGPALLVAAIGGLTALVPFSTCPVRLAFGVPCPGCGLTRATLAAARLDLATALRFHPLCPALIAVAAAMVSLAFITSDATWRRAVAIVTGGGAAALVAVWALRFAGFFGGPVP